MVKKRSEKVFYLVFPPVECLAKANPATAVCQTHRAQHQPCFAACQSPSCSPAQIIQVIDVLFEAAVWLRQLGFAGIILDATVVGEGTNNAKVNIN